MRVSTRHVNHVCKKNGPQMAPTDSSICVEMVDVYCTLPFLHSYFTFSILVSFSITFGIVLLFFLFCFSLDLSCILSLLYLFCISCAPLLFQSLYAGKAASYNFVFLCSATAQNHRSIALFYCRCKWAFLRTFLA